MVLQLMQNQTILFVMQLQLDDVALFARITELGTLSAVARERNFSRAAELLNIAQPPLSRQIQQLEETLGARLIDRSSRPLTLTEAGRFFYEQASQMIARMEHIREQTHRIARSRRVTVHGTGSRPSRRTSTSRTVRCQTSSLG